ncbi:hypothetical protein GCM10023184_32130 [Flaviaesturariibacter amylovorans]|uniref:Inovirus Gp2 family protein n=1 Tax=Flaviaesturariibacter amylovorans TaxID=1084520 RepID=A0ABP8HBA1_9BACT
MNKKKYLNTSILSTANAFDPTDAGLEAASAHQGLTITIDQKHLASQDQNQFVLTGTTADNAILYYDIKAFSKHFEISEAAIRRVIACIKTRWRYEYCLSYGYKHFVSPMILLLLKRRRKGLRNAEYASFLHRYTWSTVGSIRFREPFSADRCRVIMERLGKKLAAAFPTVVNYYFYVTEENCGKDGFHNHFVYGNHALPENEAVVSIVNRHLEYYGGRYEKKSVVEKMDQKDYFLEYLVKQMHRMPDHYNWLHSNLFK